MQNLLTYSCLSSDKSSGILKTILENLQERKNGLSVSRFLCALSVPALPLKLLLFSDDASLGGAATHGRDLGSKQPSGCLGVPCEHQPLKCCPWTALDTSPSPGHGHGGLLAGGDHAGLDLRESLRGASPEGGQDLGFVPKGQGPALPSPLTSSNDITVYTIVRKELHNSLSAEVLESPPVAISAAS